MGNISPLTMMYNLMLSLWQLFFQGFLQCSNFDNLQQVRLASLVEDAFKTRLEATGWRRGERCVKVKIFYRQTW
jgi:hypothetical protein